MPAEMLIKKTAGGFTVDPAYAQDYQALAYGQVFKAVLTKPRNPAFHRKVFALLQVAYEAWEKPQAEYRGEPVATSFDRFRKDLVILAGHYDIVTNIRGEVRAEAKSLSFGNLDEVEFQQVYSDLINAILKHILTDKTEDELNEWVDAVLAFD